MKIELEDVRALISTALTEVKKAPKKGDSPPSGVLPKEYAAHPALDFSEPLGDRNRLKRQGSDPGWGPTTEQKIRMVVRTMVREAMGSDDPSMTPQIRQKVQTLGSKFPWFGDWIANVGNHPGDVMAKMSYAEKELTSKGAKGMDFIDGIMVAAEMLRGQG